MPKTLTLRDVPDPVVRAIREQAKRNRRSMQKEVLSILQGSVLDRRSMAEQLAELRARTKSMTLEEIDGAIREGRP